MPSAKLWRSLNKKELVSLGVGAIATVGAFVVASHDGTDTRRVEFLLGIIIFLLVPIYVLQLFRGAQFRQLSNQLRSYSEIDAGNRVNANISIKLAESATHLATYGTSLRNVGRASIDSALDRVVIYPRKQKVSAYGRELAFKCYTNYWEEIVRLQVANDRPLIASMIHSSDIHEWQDEYLDEIGPLHLNFAEHGGLAFRILINREDRSASSLSEYIAFLNQMEKDKAYGVYVSLDSLEDDSPPRKYLEADFCILSAEHLVARWELDRYGQVKRFTLVKDDKKYRGHTREWDSIIGKVLKADYSQETANRDHIAALERHRLRFRRAMQPWEPEFDQTI